MSSDKKKNDIKKLRKKLMEWGSGPFVYQFFNKEEALNWRNPRFHDYMAQLSLNSYYRSCIGYESFDFSIDEPMIIGKVKHCSYSELDRITNFNNPQVIQKTINGRLFHGIIVEGFEERPVIVKTWDFLLPMREDTFQCLIKFCDETELFIDERVNMHPNLVKLYGYCCDTRLAVVFDEKFTGLMLSDVLLSDDFGWDERMKVVTQLADLFSCLHDNKIALGCVTPQYIMIDKGFNIKVFDFGYVTDGLHVSHSFLDHAKAPEILKGERTIKSDVYFFGILLLELMAKKKFSFSYNPIYVKTLIEEEAKAGKNKLVDECFTEVDGPTALDLTLLVFRCTDFDPHMRPSMKDVIDTLNAMGMRGEKRKRDENDAEQNKRCF